MKRILSGLALLWAAPAMAEVKAADDDGFTVSFVATIAASPARVWDALVHPGRWWNMAHSYSQDGRNLTLDPVAGGCFCETVPRAKGSVEHLRVVQALPGVLLRMTGGLGPFQSMAVTGVMNWDLKPVAAGTELRMSYAIGGKMPGGGKTYAPIVDGVLGDQFARLKSAAEK